MIDDHIFITRQHVVHAVHDIITSAPYKYLSKVTHLRQSVIHQERPNSLI